MSTYRVEFEMSEAQLNTLLTTMQPTPYIAVNGTTPISQSNAALNAWKRLSDEMGFDHMTAAPSRINEGDRFFTATPRNKT